METETGRKEEQWKNSNSISSSSRSSSITSASSDGHFDIRHFPLPKPTLSALEAQKQRDSYQAYTFSSVSSSYTGSSWSSAHQFDLPGYDPSRIPSSVFSSKPASSAEWSIASNESLFSLHNGNSSISTKEDLGLKSGDIPKFEETVQEITEIKPIPLPPPLPPVKKPNESKKEPYQGEIPNSEIDDPEEEEEDEEMIQQESEDEIQEEEEDEEMIQQESEDEIQEEEEDIIEGKVLVETETENQEQSIVVEEAKKNKPYDSNSQTSHSPSISCLSDTSNNSIGSFAFPLLQKEGGIVRTPSIEIKENISHKPRPQYQSPQRLMQPSQPQPQPHSEPSTLTQSQPQHKASKQSDSQKSLRNRWFSCCHCPSKCGFFK